MTTVFISYTYADQQFATRLAHDLRNSGIDTWIDVEQVMVGDSLIRTIGGAIKEADYLAVVLSSKSVRAGWVIREVEIAMSREIEGKRVRVLPLLIEECELPEFLRDKVYADFRKSDQYDEQLAKVLRRLHADANRESFLTLIERALDADVRTLDLEDLGHPPLPGKIGELTQLKQLRLKFNNLTELPPEIGELTNLRNLDLGDNDLKALPPEIGRLSNLEYLYVYRNGPLEVLPAEIGNLANLKRLSIYRTGLATLPREIGQLSNLESLDIGSSRLGLTSL